MQITFITRQRIILIGLLIMAFLVTMIRHWIRYILIIPVGLAAVFALATIIFPLYQEGPNFITFYKTQDSQLFFSTTQSTSRVIISNKKSKNELDGQKTTQTLLPKNLETTISFVASSQTGNQRAFLLLPEGTTVQIFPQTQISFMSQYPKISISVDEGQATASASNNYSPWQLTLSGVQENGGKNQYQKLFEKQKIQAIGAQANSIFMQNSYLKAINKWILQILTKLRPTKFQESLKNFAAFEAYVPTQNGRQTDTNIDPNISQDMVNQASRGLEETQIYQRWKKLFE